MRCQACNRLLTDFESTRKSTTCDDYLDLCNDCYSTIRTEVKAMERPDLMSIDDVIDLVDFDDNVC